MNSKKVLVTGGAGYIGAHTVVELMKEGYDVTIVDNLSRTNDTLLVGIEKITGKKVNFQKGDCADKNFLQGVFRAHGPFSSVLHFAAFKSVGESVQQPLLYYRNNIDSTVTLLEVMKENNTTDLIFSSSCTVYGQPDIIPANEDAPFKRAESPYGATKQMCERILEDVYQTGLRVISLRYFNPIGAHPSGLIGELPVGAPNNLVPYITQTAAGVRDKLVIFGDDYQTPDGTCVRDFIHVTDLAIAHLKAMEYLSSLKQTKVLEVFNLGTGKGVSVMELVRTFIATTKVDLPYSIGPRRPGDVEKVFADPRKANAVLKWKTNYSLDDSLLHAWQWERKIRGIAN